MTAFASLTCQTELVNMQQIRWPTANEPPATLGLLTTEDVIFGLTAVDEADLQSVGDMIRLAWTRSAHGEPIVILIDRADDSFVWCIRWARLQNQQEIDHWREVNER